MGPFSEAGIVLRKYCESQAVNRYIDVANSVVQLDATKGLKNQYNLDMGEANPTTRSTRKPAKLSRSQQTAIFKALADPHRFELLQQIAKAGCPLGCSQALSALPISAATLSHHVKELETAGLIDIRREGKFAYLTLRQGVLEAVASSLSALESAGCSRR